MATKNSKSAPLAKATAGETAIGANKPVDSVKHAKAQRLFIPSREEAGQEADALQGQPTVKAVPLNPVTHRGQDPELYWMHKYDSNDQQTALNVDIRSLYRHEHIAPEKIIARLYSLKGREDAQNELFTNELFGNPLAMDELDKPGSYYKHPDKWQNRLVQGDSLLVMTSLLEREGMAAAVQCIYIDPPYGIKYGSNWQMRLGDRNVKDGADENLSGEPEVIKAFRDTWELGIHSYLSYLRDRLLVARELLNASGSCFVQISDENVHLVRCLMDEVFGSENFVALITFKKTASQTSQHLASTCDYLLWYAKDADSLKFRSLYRPRGIGDEGADAYGHLKLSDGSTRRLAKEEIASPSSVPEGARAFRFQLLTSQREGRQAGEGSAMYFPVCFAGKDYFPGGTRGWTTTEAGVRNLIAKSRVGVQGTTLSPP